MIIRQNQASPHAICSCSTHGRLFVLLLLLLSISLICAACSMTPSTEVRFIHKSDNHLFVITKDGIIKIIKADTGELVDRIKFPDMKYGGRYISPDVINILEDKGALIIEAYQSNITPKDVNVYHLKDRKLKKIGSLPYSSPLIASDDDHYYAIEGLLLQSGFRMEPPQGESLRYNKKDLTDKSDIHLGDPQFILKDISEDNNSFWYAGFQRGSGKIGLFSKEITSGKLDRFIDETEMLFPTYISDEINSIWFIKPNGGRTKIAIFSKEEKTFRQAELPVEIAPVPHGKLLTESPYLWAMAPSMREQQIYRIRKQDLSVTSLPIPRDVSIDFFKVPVFSDDDNIWIGGTKPTGYSPPVPYILRLHKKDMAVEGVLIKATPFESLQAAYENISRWLLAPILGGKQ